MTDKHQVNLIVYTGLCTKNDTRLIGGENRFVGRIEICSDFGWYGAVCSNSVDSPEAAVACRELFGSNMSKDYSRSI